MVGITLRPDAHPLERIAQELEAAPETIDDLHIVAHARPGTLLLGDLVLNADSLPRHADLLGRIGRALGPDGLIAITACEVAAGDAGAAFMDALTAATGVRVVGTKARVGGQDADSFALTGDMPSPFAQSARAAYAPHLAQVFAGDFFTGRAIDMSREGGGGDFIVGGPASQGSNPNNQFHFTPVNGGRAFFEGQGFNNPATGIVNRVIVDSEGGNTTRFGIQGLEQTLETMQTATWDFYQTNILNGNDTMTGSYEADHLVGYAGNDILIGGLGDKTEFPADDGSFQGSKNTLRDAGQRADQQFWIADGNDTLDGEDGNDTLDGGTGDDRLIGGADDDEIFGGDGADTAVLAAASSSILGQGRDLFGSFEITSADGTDVIHDDVEFIEFTDTTLTFAEVLAAVTATNEAPTDVALTGATTDIDENTDTSSRLKVADIGITDDALGSNDLALIGADAALFEIDGTELFLRAGTVLDFETQAQLDVSVTVDDSTVGSTPDASVALRIAVNDVNEAPTAVALTGATTDIDENTDTSSRLKVADIGITDDALGSNDLALTGADAALFEIDGTELFLRAGTVLDFETQAQLDVSVTVDDTTVGATPDDSAALSVAVTDVDEGPDNLPPVARADAAAVDEGNTIAIEVLANDSDPDEDNLTVTAVSGAVLGVASVSNNRIIYRPDPDPDPDAEGEDALSYTVSDGTVEVTGTVTVTVTADDNIDGTGVSDTLLGTVGPDTINGNNGNDTIDGGDGDDVINTGIGFDVVEAGGGNDLVRGLNGFDTLNGGAGNDTLQGNAGNDELNGDDDDLLIGGIGSDVMGGDAGDDLLQGQGGFDTLDGGTGNDTLQGNNSNDLLNGGAGDDRLEGGFANDVLNGEAGNDTLEGGNGADLLNGGEGDDRLEGNAGSDTLDGGAGADVLRGGLGADTFVFRTGSGNDRVLDLGNVDSVALEAALLGGGTPVADDLRALSSLDADGFLVLDFGGGDTLTFSGITNTGAILDDVSFI